MTKNSFKEWPWRRFPEKDFLFKMRVIDHYLLRLVCTSNGYLNIPNPFLDLNCLLQFWLKLWRIRNRTQIVGLTSGNKQIIFNTYWPKCMGSRGPDIIWQGVLTGLLDINFHALRVFKLWDPCRLPGHLLGDFQPWLVTSSPSCSSFPKIRIKKEKYNLN